MSSPTPPPPPGGTPAVPGPGSGAGRPSGADAGGDPVASGHVRTTTRTPLSHVPSPYGLWIAAFAILIFSGPNLAVLAAGQLADGVEAVARPNSAQLVFSLVVTLVFQVAISLAALLPLLAAGRPWSRLLGPTRATGVMWAVGLGVGVGVVVAAFTVNGTLAVLLEVEEGVEQQILQDALAGGVPTVLVGIMTVVVAPVAEEVLFRGVLFRAMAARLGLWVGAVLSSAVFAVIHFEILFSQPIALAGLFVVGLLLAFAYHLTGSIVVPILGHAVFNASSLTLALFVDRFDLEDLERVAVVLRPLWTVGRSLGA